VHFNFAAFNFAVELKIHFSWRFNFAWNNKTFYFTV